VQSRKQITLVFVRCLTSQSVWSLWIRGVFLLAVHTLYAWSSTVGLPWKKGAKRLLVNTVLITLLLRSVDIGNFDLQFHLSDESDNNIFA